jgi:prolyl oligopeptidase
VITPVDDDDRVVPDHSFKFVATLQAVKGWNKPTLIRIEITAGHGAGKPTAKLIDNSARRSLCTFRNWGCAKQAASRQKQDCSESA